MDAAMSATKSLPNVSKIDWFDGNCFKHQQQTVCSTLDMHNLAHFLTKKQPVLGSKGYEENLPIWEKGNKIYCYTILSTLSNELLDIYCNYKNAKEIWDLLYKKYAIGNFSNFQMSEEKDVSSQNHDFHVLVNDLKNKEITLPETFIAGFLIERLPKSWKDYKNNLKPKRKHMTLEDVIVHIRIEEKNRLRDKASLAK